VGSEPSGDCGSGNKQEDWSARKKQWNWDWSDNKACWNRDWSGNMAGRDWDWGIVALDIGYGFDLADDEAELQAIETSLSEYIRPTAIPTRI